MWLTIRSISLRQSPRPSRERVLNVSCCLVEQARWLTRSKKRGFKAPGAPPNILSQSSLATEASVESTVSSAAFRNSLSGAKVNNPTTPFLLSAKEGAVVFAGPAAQSLLAALPSETSSEVHARLLVTPPITTAATV